MKIPHAFWLPERTDDFLQTGAFQLWAETPERRRAGRSGSAPVHPFSMTGDAWSALFEALRAKPSTLQLDHAPESCTIHLPSTVDAPFRRPSW